MKILYIVIFLKQSFFTSSESKVRDEERRQKQGHMQEATVEIEIETQAESKEGASDLRFKNKINKGGKEI